MLKYILVATILATSATAADRKPSVSNGRKLYVETGCYQCHGYEGQGGSAGLALAPEPMPLDALMTYIRNSDKVMPPYPASILPDEQVADIHAFLTAIRPAPKVDSLPLLRDLK
ncbi:MAG: cytochrome c [Alphaproteobacteria bacterium]|nr:cytochrome c [Alphaproteobacteria bacterium]